MSTGRAAVGHPVDVASGAVFTISQDFVLPGTTPLVWSRYYASDADVDTWLGRGWTVPYFMRLERLADAYQLTDEEGRPVVFPVASGELRSGEWVRNLSASMELWRDGDLYVVQHWHPGGVPVERYGFVANPWSAMPLAWWDNVGRHRITVRYDAAGRPVGLTQEPEGRAVELAYDRRELITAAYLIGDDGRRDPLVAYEYDADRHLTASVNAAGGRIEYAYDGAHRMMRETGPLGASFRFTYDGRGRCVHTTGDDGYMERRLRYHAAPKSTEVTNGAGHTTRYYLNDVGQVLQQVSPLGAVTTNEFDEHGRLTRTVDPGGGAVAYAYDEDGNRASTTDQAGGTIAAVYNGLHLPVEVVDATGAACRFEYDARGALTSTINALGHRWRYGRDARGLVVRAEKPGGLVVEHAYAPGMRAQESRDQFGFVQRVEYDTLGNAVAVYDAAGLAQRLAYDATGRVLWIEPAAGGVARLRYNALGQMVERRGPEGEFERWDYDRFGQITAQTNSLGDVFRLEYDAEGRPTAVTDRAGGRMTMAYDADGARVEERRFDGSVHRFDYDAAGYRTRIVRPDGREIRQSFDEVGNLVGREGDGGLRETFAYDAAGRVVRAATPAVVVEFERDVLGRVTSERQNGRGVEHKYDADNNRVARRLAGAAPDAPAAVVRLSVDPRGRLRQIADAAGPFQRYEWDELDRLTVRTSAGGVREEFAYNGARRVELQTVTAGVRGVVARRRYEYDQRENVTEVDDQRRGRTSFSYDAANRLVATTRNGAAVESYDYDPNDAIRATRRGPRVVGPGGRTHGDGERAYEYDANGAIVAAHGGNGRVTLSYDVDGQLVRVDAGGTTTEFVYDALGRRVAKTADGRTTVFVWDGGRLAAEFRDERLADAYLVFDHELAAQWHDGARIVPIRDRTGAVQETLSDEGVLLWECTLDPYGRVLGESGGPRCPFRYPGQYDDAETGLYYNFYRYYDPRLAGYVAPDPIGLEGGANLYSYPRNPLQWDDPFGLSCSNKHKGQMGERRMDKYYRNRGYKPIASRGRPRGIDGVYENTNPPGHPEGPPPQYVIVESKYGTSQPRRTVDNNMQLSDNWIEAPIAGTGPPRLEAAVGKPAANNVTAAATTPGQVQKEVFHAPPGSPGYATNHGNYVPGSGDSEL